MVTATAKKAAPAPMKKGAVKTVTRTPAPAKRSPVAATKKAVAEAVPKKMPKMASVRSSFNLEVSEYAVLSTLKKSLSTDTAPVKKGQLVRAAILLLRAVPATQLTSMISKLPALKAPAKK